MYSYLKSLSQDERIAAVGIPFEKHSKEVEKREKTVKFNDVEKILRLFVFPQHRQQFLLILSISDSEKVKDIIRENRLHIQSLITKYCGPVVSAHLYDYKIANTGIGRFYILLTTRCH
jgi:hypothetical protein